MGDVFTLVAGGACCSQVVQGVFAASALGDDVVHLGCWCAAIDTGAVISAHYLLAESGPVGWAFPGGAGPGFGCMVCAIVCA